MLYSTDDVKNQRSLCYGNDDVKDPSYGNDDVKDACYDNGDVQGHRRARPDRRRDRLNKRERTGRVGNGESAESALLKLKNV